MKKDSEYERFNSTMRELIKVPHTKIKAKLDAEKKGEWPTPSACFQPMKSRDQMITLQYVNAEMLV